MLVCDMSLYSVALNVCVNIMYIFSLVFHLVVDNSYLEAYIFYCL